MYSLQIKENRQFFFFFMIQRNLTRPKSSPKKSSMLGASWVHNSYLNVSKVIGSIRYSAVSFELHEKASGGGL